MMDRVCFTENEASERCSREKVFSKLLVRLEKKPGRTARHRYERPSTMEAQRHRTVKPMHDISSATLSYSKLLSDMLTFHNYYRARHSASPLTISQRLNLIAQSYAEQLASTSKFEHSGNLFQNDILGENLYMQWISKGQVPVSARTAVKSWYEEIDLYDFKRPNYSEETGHFTQMVWKSTRKMGMGVAVSADGREVYFVTNYYPAGNIVNHGYFETNVLSH